ncbi:MAG: GAF domain-containing SpoIIE family protein phosphatase [Planctomycetota bacterium]
MNTTDAAAADGVPPPGGMDQRDIPAELPSTLIPFMTSGWLPHLCESLSTLAGRSVTLHDASGVRIAPSDTENGYTIEPAPRRPSPAGTLRAPILVEGRPIGELRAEPRPDDPAADAELARAMETLAQGSAEVCAAAIGLGHRVREMSAMYRITSLLARATDLEAILGLALGSAVDALGLDAGSIVLFEDENSPEADERGVQLKTSRGLSEAWLADPRPLSVGREFDYRAAHGEVVLVEDLRTDPRIIGVDRVEAEGVVGFVTCAMLIQGRAIGAIRLYDREPRLLDAAEQRLVRSIAEQAGLAIEQARLLELQAEDRKIQRQLQLAGDVQRRMLPTAMPAIEPFDVAARYVPSFDLGGDFYDVFAIGDRARPHLGFAVGDVVGKGVPAALLMASVRASLRAYAQEVYDLDEIVARTNRALARDTTESEFVTLWYGVADPQTRHLTYCAAGHEPPLIARVPEHRAPTTADIDELATGGMVLGIDPSQRYQRGHFDLMPGDVLVAYTDGITDARDFSDQRFGKRRLIASLVRILAEEPDASAETIIDRVFWHIRQFAGLSVRQDDQTLLVMRARR